MSKLWGKAVPANQLVTPESIKQGELIEPNAALEGSMLDPLSLIGGGGAATLGGRALNEAGKGYFKGVRNMDPGSADLGRRASSLAVAGAIGHAIDPVSAAKNVAKSTGNSLDFGLPGSGMADAITTGAAKLQDNIRAIASARKYRMDKVAGKEPDKAFLDSYIANKKMPFDNAANQLDFVSKVVDGSTGSALWDQKGYATMKAAQAFNALKGM